MLQFRGKSGCLQSARKPIAVNVLCIVRPTSIMSESLTGGKSALVTPVTNIGFPGQFRKNIVQIHFDSGQFEAN